VTHALSGSEQSISRVDSKGETIISIAVRSNVPGCARCLALSTQGDDIDKIIASERGAIVRIFLVSSVIMLLLSYFIAGTIAEPIRRLRRRRSVCGGYEGTPGDPRFHRPLG